LRSESGEAALNQPIGAAILHLTSRQDQLSAVLATWRRIDIP
jgi:hypothetical protein